MTAPTPGNPAAILGTREHAEAATTGRHPGIRDGMQWLTYAHLPEQLRRFSEPFYVAAYNKLIEAKDSAMRAGIRAEQGRAGSVPRPQEVVLPPKLAE